MSDLIPIWEQAGEIQQLKKEVAQLKERNVYLESELNRRTQMLEEIIQKMKTLNDHGGI